MLQAVDEKIAHRENQLMVLEQLKLKMEELRTSHKQLEGRKSQIEHLETAENKQCVVFFPEPLPNPLFCYKYFYEQSPL